MSQEAATATTTTTSPESAIKAAVRTPHARGDAKTTSVASYSSPTTSTVNHDAMTADTITLASTQPDEDEDGDLSLASTQADNDAATTPTRRHSTVTAISTSPDTADVLAAFKRCAAAAAERRRAREAAAAGGCNDSPLAINHHQHEQVWVPSSLDESTLSPQSATEAATTGNDHTRDDRHTARTNENGEFSFSKSAYCCELFADLECLDRALHYDKTNFRPLHVRRLISEEIHRVESGIVGEDRAAHPPQQAGLHRNVAPVLQTIGLPPLHTRSDSSQIKARRRRSKGTPKSRTQDTLLDTTIIGDTSEASGDRLNAIIESAIRHNAQGQRLHFTSAKIFLPEIANYNFIGRIIGPRGMSVRRLETETTCKILIRGRGSVKDQRRHDYLVGKDSSQWRHLNEPLHVYVTALDTSMMRSRMRLEFAVDSLMRLLTPQYDEYKRQQLAQLAIVNGNYRAY